MKVLIIYAHPRPQSFNHAILESFINGLSKAGHTYEVVDLYAVNFNPCLSENDFRTFSEGEVPDDIRIQQEKVSWAEGIVFIHPVWWTGPPAILKGWVDRVFSLGFAYSIDAKEGHVTGLLRKQKALVINTAGGTEEEAKMFGTTDALKKIEDDLIFRFVGITNVEHAVFYNVNITDDATRRGYLEETHNLGKNF